MLDRDETYARRLAVVLIAILEQEGDVDDAPALERAGTSVVDTLRTADGEAEPLAADQIVGTFDTPIGAVEAGLRAHHALRRT